MFILKHGKNVLPENWIEYNSISVKETALLLQT